VTNNQLLSNYLVQDLPSIRCSVITRCSNFIQHWENIRCATIFLN